MSKQNHLLLLPPLQHFLQHRLPLRQRRLRPAAEGRPGGRHGRLDLRSTAGGHPRADLEIFQKLDRLETVWTHILPRNVLIKKKNWFI